MLVSSFYDIGGRMPLLQIFHPGNCAGLLIRENFQPGYRDLGYRASLPSQMNLGPILQK